MAQSCPAKKISDAHCIKMEVVSTYISAALEEDRFMTWAFRIGKSGYGLGRFVFKAGKHLMHTIWAKGLEEPLATYIRQ